MGSRLTSSWKTVAIAAAGEVVLTERVDDFITEDGGRISIPLMGSFRVRNGEIVEWRDYFDLGDLTRQAERANIAL
ncbi:Epoxide hydrolase EphG [compost metagenome]